MQLRGNADDQRFGFTLAGRVQAKELNMPSHQPPVGRRWHEYGGGPFARFVMPSLPREAGLYLWEVNGEIVYVGSTEGTLQNRLGPRGYSSISRYNTLAREPGRENGGQQTNCRINTLANAACDEGSEIKIWYQVTRSTEAKGRESAWMERFGVPRWNRRDERNTRRNGNSL
jgi:hypothetical protein